MEKLPSSNSPVPEYTVEESPPSGEEQNRNLANKTKEIAQESISTDKPNFSDSVSEPLNTPLSFLAAELAKSPTSEQSTSAPILTQFFEPLLTNVQNDKIPISTIALDSSKNESSCPPNAPISSLISSKKSSNYTAKVPELESITKEISSGASKNRNETDQKSDQKGGSIPLSSTIPSSQTQNEHSVNENQPLGITIESVQQASTYSKDSNQLQHKQIDEDEDLTESKGLGLQIGPYHLIKVLGEGGMGTVYLAEQIIPMKRLVALKLIRTHMVHRTHLLRFQVEQQALALMNHPNIAKVLDAGTNQQNEPFFVMELVPDGETLLQYANKNSLSIEKRIQLLINICLGVYHAHQKGIIHRDLKPSNILVGIYDGQSIPKIIDFGIAKAISGNSLTEESPQTIAGVVLGTLEYMSPEQASRGEIDIDTRSDIYSLGIILCELLTGTTPIRSSLKGCHLLKALQKVSEFEFQSLTSAVETLEESELIQIVTERKISKNRFLVLIQNELNWIVRKALAKDREQRYNSALGLAEDLQRFISGDAILAHPPSRWYHLRKMLRKNRLAIMTSSAIFLLFLGMTIFSVIQERRSRTQKGIAENERELAEIARNKEALARQEAINQRDRMKRIIDFLYDQVFALARPIDQDGGMGAEVKLIKALDQSEQKIKTLFANDPDTEQSLREHLSRTNYLLGRYEEAIRQAQAGLDLNPLLHDPKEGHELELLNELALASKAKGNLKQTISILEKLVQLSKENWAVRIQRF